MEPAPIPEDVVMSNVFNGGRSFNTTTSSHPDNIILPQPDLIFSASVEGIDGASELQPQPDPILSGSIEGIEGATEPQPQPDLVLSGTINGSVLPPPDHDRKAKRKAVKKRSYAKSKKKENVWKLKQVSAKEFCDKLMIHVYKAHQKTNTSKLELDPIPKGETLDGYLEHRGKDPVQLVGPNKSLVKATILPFSWFDGNKTRTAWEKNKKESAAKTKINNATGSHAKNLKALLNRNIDEKYRDRHETAEYEENNNVTFAEYADRPFAFKAEFEVKDVSVMENYVVPAFVKCSTYSYDEDDTKEVPQDLYWNGKKLCTSKLLYVRLADTPQYVIIDGAKNKEDKQLVIDTTNLRSKKVAFYRVGDFLSREEIDRIITTCESCKDAIPTFILICVKYRHHHLIKKHELATQKSNKIEHEDDITKVAEDFVKALREELCNHYDAFTLQDFDRMSWVTWSPFNQSHDVLFSKKDTYSRQNARNRATDRYAPKEEKQQVYEDSKQLNYFMILSITQQGTDQDVFRMFRCISDGFSTLNSYLKVLEQIPFEEFFEVLVEICRPRCGMYTTRALTILSIFVVSAILFDGKAPTESIDILSFWQINEKKANLIRNCMKGVYDGVGVDTHVIQFLTACAALKGVKRRLKEKDFYRLGKNVQEDPGAYMNEIIGECGQSFNAHKDESGRWGKWKAMLQNVSRQRDEFKQIIDGWLPGWDKE